MSHKEEPRLEVSLNWFDQWTVNWSCDKATWKQLSKKLKSPLVMGVAIGTGIAIGFVQVSNSRDSEPRSRSIEAPVQKGEQ